MIVLQVSQTTGQPPASTVAKEKNTAFTVPKAKVSKIGIVPMSAEKYNQNFLGPNWKDVVGEAAINLAFAKLDWAGDKKYSTKLTNADAGKVLFEKEGYKLTFQEAFFSSASLSARDFASAS